ncbi:hypothetical protein PENTCL1PPCAC_23212, partial [Pristionchus entomophagus]
EDLTEASTSSQHRRSGIPCEKQCTLCARSFVSTSSANRHLRTIHGIDTSLGNAGYIIDAIPSSGETETNPSSSLPSLAANREITEKSDTRNPPQRSCDVCHKSFSTGSTLNRHLRNVHGVDTSARTDGTSPLPSSSLLDSSLSSLILSVLPHPLEITVDSKEGIGLMGKVKEEEEGEEREREDTFPIHNGTENGDDGASEDASRDYDDCMEIRCDLCGKVFSQPSTLNRHLREIHKIATVRKEQPMKPAACSVCGEILRSQSLALRHRREAHGSATKISRLGTQCAIQGCHWTGHTHRDLVTHAQSSHSSSSSLFQWQARSFETTDHFDRWLEEIRQQGVEWYSRSSKTVDGVKQEYRYCYLEIAGRGRRETEEKRRIHCTSYIKLLLHDDSSVTAEFCLDHLGHEGRHCQNEKEGEEGIEEEEMVDQNGIDQIEDDSQENSLDLDDIPGPSRNSQSPFDSVSLLVSDAIDSELSPSSSRSRRCHSCKKEFSCGSTLYRHLREVHKEEHPKSLALAIKTPCAVCGEIFPSGAQMRVHRSSSHPGSLGHRMNCPIEGCQWNGSTHRDLIKHARSFHSFPHSPFLWQNRVFSCQDEFNEWLEELKKRGAHFYIRRSEKRRSLKVENRCCYFEENRTRGVSTPSRQRKKFSRKSVRSCTCYLTLTIHEDGTIDTGYCLDHLGHTVDLEERPFRQREGRNEEEEENEEEGEENEERGGGIEEEPIDIKQDLDEIFSIGCSSIAHEDSFQSITVQDLHRFQESLARLSAGAARLRYSNEMDRLVTYLDDAFIATGLLNERREGVKRRMEERIVTNGKRVKREETDD